MAQVRVKKTTIKKKNNSSQRKLTLRRVAINNSMNRLRSSARK